MDTMDTEASMLVDTWFASLLERSGACALRLGTTGALLAALTSSAAAQFGGLAQSGPVEFDELDNISLVLIPEIGEKQIQEVQVFDYVNDMDPMIQAGYPVVWPDLPVRAFRDALGEVQLVLPVAGMNHFVTSEILGGNVRLIGADFDSLTPCIGSSCRNPCDDEDCLVLRSDALHASCHFDDEIWLSSVYRDGSDVFAMTHMEYQSQSRDFNDFPVGQPAECDSCQQNHPSCCNGIPRVFGLNLNNAADNAAADVFCQHTSLTFAKSTDDGETFQQAPEYSQSTYPDLVAYGPYEFVPDPQDHLCLSDPMDPDSPKVTCPYSGTPYGGYAQPSNIVQHPEDGYYYMIVRQHLPPKFQDDHPGVEQLWAEVQNSIIVRTDDLSDPDSWRAWGGSFDTGGEPIYDVVLPDPYRDSMDDPIDHVGYPLNPFWQYAGAPGVNITIAVFSGGLHWNTYLRKWVLVDEAPFFDENNTPSSGIFFSISDDLINWSARKLTDPPIKRRLGERNLFPTIIDHDCPTDNFDRGDRIVHFYYQRPIPNGNLEADVFRVRAEFQIH